MQSSVVNFLPPAAAQLLLWLSCDDWKKLRWKVKATNMSCEVTKIWWRWQVKWVMIMFHVAIHFGHSMLAFLAISNHLKIENLVIGSHHWLKFVWQCREAFYFYTKSVYGYGWLCSRGLVVPFELDSAICVREANRLSLQWTPALILFSVLTSSMPSIEL